MAKKFVVTSASRAWLSITPLQALAVVVPVLATVVATQRLQHQRIRMVLIYIGGLVLLLLLILLMVGSFVIRGGNSEEKLEVTVSVNQLSVQLSNYRDGKLIGYPMLISRRDILDIVVNEVILSHKVVSVLVFRVLKLVGTATVEATKAQPIHTLLKDGKIRLQVAFPGVEMSYKECMTMRREISQTLMDYY